jgi:threonine synthase
MIAVETLECTACGRSFDPGAVRYTCPDHDGASGVLDVRYDYDAIHDAFDATLDGTVPSMWKYDAFLPVDSAAQAPVSLGEGGTDLLSAPTLGDDLGVTLTLKREGANPTGSSKDRGSSVVVSRARAAEFDVVACASTGNAAASLAGYAARGGLDCRIFVPADVPEAKAVQPRAYGADVLAVRGGYGDAYDLCRQAAAEHDWYNRSAAMNPYAVEGLRTIGHEVVDQSVADAGRVPDWVVLPMGNGCTLAGVWKGLREFRDLGFVDRTPRLLGVQAAAVSPITDGFDGPTEDDSDGDTGATLADSIDVETPHNAGKARRALDASDGTAVTVTDDQITTAQRRLGATTGVFAEPASAASVAGLRRARDRGVVDAGESVVAIVTGTGLKDVDAAARATGEVEYVDPTVAAVPDHY